jgi:hypothetical protein
VWTTADLNYTHEAIQAVERGFGKRISSVSGRGQGCIKLLISANFAK